MLSLILAASLTMQVPPPPTPAGDVVTTPRVDNYTQNQRTIAKRRARQAGKARKRMYDAVNEQIAEARAEKSLAAQREYEIRMAPSIAMEHANQINAAELQLRAQAPLGSVDDATALNKQSRRNPMRKTLACLEARVPPSHPSRSSLKRSVYHLSGRQRPR
jgi:hypothetical protein